MSNSPRCFDNPRLILIKLTVLLLGGVILVSCQGKLFPNLVEHQPAGLPELIAIIGKYRLSEARLTGGFDYAPYILPVADNKTEDEDRAVIDEEGEDTDYRDYFTNNAINQSKRSGSSNKINSGVMDQISQDELLNFKSVAKDIFFTAAYHPSPEAFGTVAIVHFAKGEIREATKNLEKATKMAPANARLFNDLAVAYYTRAEIYQQPRDLTRALKAVDAAIAADSSLPEAHFNRALILQKLYLSPTAQFAWQEYLTKEKSPKWANEAKKNLASLNEPKIITYWQNELARLVAMESPPDQNIIKNVVANYPHLIRFYVLDELLPAWAEATLKHQDYEKKRLLRLIQEIGAALIEIQEDRLIGDLCSSLTNIGRTANQSDSQLNLLANAHLSYRTGRQFMDKNEFDRAVEKFNNAQAAFNQLNESIGATLTYLQLARCNVMRLNYNQALMLLDKVSLTARKKGYTYLLGRVWWSKAMIQTYSFDLSNALSSSRMALIYLEKSVDLESLARIHLLISEILDQIGETDEIWQHQRLALAYLNRIDSPRRVSVINGIASQIARLGEPSIALYFHNEAIEAAKNISNHLIVANAFLRRSQLYHSQNEYVKAREDLQNARIFADKIEDRTTFQRLQQELIIIEGKYKLAESPKEAVKLFTAALEAFQGTLDRYRITQLFLLRGRAHLALGENSRAEADFNAGIQEYEQQRHKLNDEEHRIAFLEESQSVYDEMIRFQTLQWGNVDSAFDYVEIARARTLLDTIEGQKRVVKNGNQKRLLLDGRATPMPLTRVQQELPGNLAIIEYYLLSDRLLIWVIQHDSARLTTIPVAINEIESLAIELRAAIEQNRPHAEINNLSKSLYDLIFRPLKALLPEQGSNGQPLSLVFVPDRALNIVPFAVLFDSSRQRYLIEDYVISLAPSANIFIRCLKRDRQLISQNNTDALVIGNPGFNSIRFPYLTYLSHAEAEAKIIAALYQNAELLIGKAATKPAFLRVAGKCSVIHFAGHAIMNLRAPLYSMLVFAPAPDRDNDEGTLTAYQLYDQRFPRTRIVVLAACRTASGHYTRTEGITGMARPFIAAGVPAVIASLWDVDDEASAAFFTIFHKERLAGKDSVSALRAAQIAYLSNVDPALRTPSLWASFVLLGGTVSDN